MNPMQTGSSSSRGQAMRGGYSSKYDKVPKGYKTGQLQQFDRRQMELYNNSFANLGPDSDLARMAAGDQEAFAEMEAPALKQFSELQGGIASRFSGAGSSQGGLGTRHSSGFQNTMNQASQDFAGQLQSQRMGLRRQAMLDLSNMTNELLGQRPVERALVQKPQKQDKGALGGWGGAVGAVAGGGIGYMAAGPYGAYYGASAGSKAMSGM